jgi:hypothetical protein
MQSLGIHNNPARSLSELSEFVRRDSLERPEAYRIAIDGVLDVLRREDGLIRLDPLPTIVIPDVHARRAMLTDILSFQLQDGPYIGNRIFDLLQQKLIYIVCLGDIMHSELRSDWVTNDNGDWANELLEKEMVRSLNTASLIMYLKMQYPTHFHCLRGNHDDIAGELAEDFRKYVGVKYENNERVMVQGRPLLTSDKGESKIVRNWILTRSGWGQPFLYLWSQFDRALPVFATGAYYVVSHTLPQMSLTVSDIRNKNRPSRITFELTSQRGENREAMNRTLENLGIIHTVRRWFHGHTHVSPEINGGKFQESPDGLLIRINNQSNYVFAYVPGPNDKARFDPLKDVYIKTPTEATFHR